LTRLFQSNNLLVRKYIHQPITIAIGAFDGCHLGHQQILSQVDIAITFSPLPKVFFEHSAHLLTTDHEKLRLFPNFYFIEFDKTLAAFTPERFIQEVLSYWPNTQKIVVGWDFHFGAKKAGTLPVLKSILDKKRIELVVVDPFNKDGEIVKSTAIRRLIEQGLLSRANSQLGYSYFISGKVIKGKGLGKQLGFPTLNISYESHKLVPPNGVYAGSVTLDKTYKAAVSIGVNPSVDNDQVRKVEVYIVDYQGPDLYGQDIQVEMYQKINDQKKCNSKEELISKIENDVLKIQDLEYAIIDKSFK